MDTWTPHEFKYIGEEAYYNGWSEKQLKWWNENSTIIYHPIYDPEPKKTSWVWAMLAWVLGLTAP